MIAVGGDGLYRQTFHFLLLFFYEYINEDSCYLECGKGVFDIMF